MPVSERTFWHTGMKIKKEKDSSPENKEKYQRGKRKKENRQPKGGMGGRHAATTQGFNVITSAHPRPRDLSLFDRRGRRYTTGAAVSGGGSKEDSIYLPHSFYIILE